MAITETEKFNNMVQAIGSDVISAIATSGAEMQVHIYFLCAWACACVYAYMRVYIYVQERMCVHITSMEVYTL